jgi:hypothetical protein
VKSPTTAKQKGAARIKEAECRIRSSGAFGFEITRSEF